MGFKIGVAIPIGYYHGASGQTIRARIVDESGGVFGAELTLVENAAVLAAGRPGFYESSFTPDAAGTWSVIIYYSSVKYGQMFYDVGGGLTTQEKADVEAEAVDALESFDLDHLLKVAHPTGDPVADSILDLLLNKDAGQTFDRTTDSLEFLGEINAAILADVTGIAGAVMRGTDGAALVADGWDAGLATILDNFTGVRIGYLDELDFGLQEAIASIVDNQLRNALGTVAGGGTGFEEDGTGLSLYTSIAGIREASWFDGTAQQALADMPYIKTAISGEKSPRVDQASIEAVNLSLHNLRPDADVIQTSEYSGILVNIHRFRIGTDGSWTAIVNGAAMTEDAGFARYSYGFPNASWQAGDLVRYTVRDGTIEIPAGSGQAYKIPQLFDYAVIGGASAIIEMLGTPGLFESTAATVNTVTCADLVDRAGLYEKMMIVPVEGDQKGMGRYITEYNGTDVLTVVPDWSTDPDASGNFRFTIIPVPEGFLYEAGKGLSASYDLINGIAQFTRVYNDHTQTDAAGTEDTIFEYDNAPYAWKPTYLMVHLDEMVDGDHIEVRIYEKDNDTDDNWRLLAHKNYFDAQSVPAKPIRLPPVDLALKVTSAQTGGAARTNLFKLYKES